MSEKNKMLHNYYTEIERIFINDTILLSHLQPKISFRENYILVLITAFNKDGFCSIDINYPNIRDGFFIGVIDKLHNHMMHELTSRSDVVGRTNKFRGLVKSFCDKADKYISVVKKNNSFWFRKGRNFVAVLLDSIDELGLSVEEIYCAKVDVILRGRESMAKKYPSLLRQTSPKGALSCALEFINDDIVAPEWVHKMRGTQKIFKSLKQKDLE